MRIRMLVDISGTTNGRPWPAKGEEMDIDDAKGAHMCAMGQALPVAVETVQRSAPEPPAARVAASSSAKIKRAPKNDD